MTDFVPDVTHTSSPTEQEDRAGASDAGAGTAVAARLLPPGPFAEAIARMPVSMLLTDATQPDYPIIFANDAFLHLTGYDAAEIIGHNCRFLQGPDTDPATVNRMRRLIAEEREGTLELLNYRRDGTPFWNRLFLSPIHDAEGRLAHYFAAQTDITREQGAEATSRALDQTQERLRLALEAGPVLGTWRWCPAERRFTADAMLARHLDLSPHTAEAGIAAEALADTFPDGGGDTLVHAFAEAPTSEVFAAELRLHDGRWARFTGGGTTADSAWQGTATDITAHHAVQEERRAASLRFLGAVDRAGSSVGRLLRERDWAATPLGPSGEWPSVLRSTLGICLNSRFPVCLYWGPEMVLLYNDPWSEIPAEKHPWALGRPAREVWRETWPMIGPMFNNILETGVAVHSEDGLLPMSRRGFMEECYFNYNVSPIYGEDGAVAGLFNTMIETTGRVLADRRNTLLRALADAAAQGRSADAVCARFAELAAEIPSDLPFLLIYRIEPGANPRHAVLTACTGLEAGGPLAQRTVPLGTSLNASLEAAAPDASEQPWPLTEAAYSRTAVTVSDLDTRLAEPLVRAPWPEAVRHAQVLPVPHPSRPHEVSALIVAGFSARLPPDENYNTFLTDFAGHLAIALSTAHSFEEERRISEQLEARVAERTAELLQTQEVLVQAQKMEAVGQLTGGIAHDFNNLLTGIVGSLELMRTRIAQGRTDVLDRYLNAAVASANRAASLTHRLLAFSRRQALDPRPTDVKQLVASMDDLVRRTTGPAVHLETVMAGGLWPTLCDPNQLENALLNLCINARDAMPDGGRLTIEAANAFLDEAYALRERDVTPGQYVAIAVSDTGSGMTAEVVERVFEPFFTTKPQGQGTGLGLSMVYGFAKQSGGHVRLYSEPDQGTTVRLYLPRHIGETAEPAPDAQRHELPRAFAGETVLVVDDEPVVRMLALELLEEMGYAAIEAAEGASALEVLRGKGRIDLLLTDVGLPGGMNGRQLADAARMLRPGLKVLFITGYAENAAIGNGVLEPGMRVITKPFALDVLGARIRAMINED